MINTCRINYFIVFNNSWTITGYSPKCTDNGVGISSVIITHKLDSIIPAGWNNSYFYGIVENNIIIWSGTYKSTTIICRSIDCISICNTNLIVAYGVIVSSSKNNRTKWFIMNSSISGTWYNIIWNYIVMRTRI